VLTITPQTIFPGWLAGMESEGGSRQYPGCSLCTRVARGGGGARARVCVCVCVCVCVFACVIACARARACAYWPGGEVFCRRG
jgi:hypothetical protein